MIVAALVLLPLTTAVAGAEPVRDVLFADDFAGPIRPCWQVYDNWSKAELKQVPSPLPGGGKALQVEVDDKSTVAWFDKGFLLVLDRPIPWSELDYVDFTYQVNVPVPNVRCFVAEDDGDWWDCTDSRPTIGAPTKRHLARDDFRAAWSDKPNSTKEKDGNVTRVFFSIHNQEPVNSGRHYVFTLADVSLGTELCAAPYRVRAEEVMPSVVVAPHDTAAMDRAPQGVTPPALVRRQGTPCALVWALWRDRGLSVDVRMIDSPSGLGVAEVTLAGVAYAPPGRRSSSFVLSMQPPAGTELREGLHVPLAIKWTDGSEFAGHLLLTRSLDPTELVAIAARSGSIALVASGELSSLQARPSVGLMVPEWLEDKVKRPRTVRGTEGLVFAADPPSMIPSHGVLCHLSYVADQPLSVGRLSLTAVLSVEGGDPVTLTRGIDVHDIDVAAMRAKLPAARAQLEALAAQRTSGRPPASWEVKEPLQARPVVRTRERPDPAQWSLIKDPVTWKDMGGGFVGGAQCGTDPGDLDLYFSHYDFGRVIKPHLSYLQRDDWRKNLEECRRRNLIVMSVWGYVPDAAWNGGFGDVAISPEQHQAILGVMGRQFLGYEMGEQDGRYIGSYAPTHEPHSRAEARKLFDDWHEQIQKHLNHYLVALGSLNFSHYYAEENHRILGLETAQGLPSDILEWAFLRGAARQYGALTWNCISVFNRWGYKSYNDTGPDHGPDKGTTLSLMRRLYYVTYLYGSATNSFESSYFLAKKPGQQFPDLSALGQANVEAVKWCREHPRRGVAYCPVAIMLDGNAGWVPPRHLYTSARQLVWGNLPYSKGDHAADALFRLVFPQYEDCSYYEDERGYLTATPCGDQFEVLLSNAQSRVLNQYQAIVVPGEVTMTEGVVARLSDFVNRGGDLVLDAAHAAALPEKVTGLAVGPGRRAAQLALLLATGRRIEEIPYVYRPVEPKGARVLAVTETGDPLVAAHPYGRGRVIVVAAENLVSAQWQDPEDKADVPLQYHLLESVRTLLTQYFQGLALVKVEPVGVQYLVNVTEDPGELIVTLVNNGAKPWSGTVTPKAGGKWTVESWLPPAPATTVERLAVTVPPGDLAVCRLRAAQ